MTTFAMGKFPAFLAVIVVASPALAFTYMCTNSPS